VTLPLASRGIMSGVILCLARAVSEFGATLMFAGNFAGRTQTMSLAVMSALETDLSAALALLPRPQATCCCVCAERSSAPSN
jgi:molybdate transport system permease protein